MIFSGMTATVEFTCWEGSDSAKKYQVRLYRDVKRSGAPHIRQRMITTTLWFLRKSGSYTFKVKAIRGNNEDQLAGV